MLYPSHIKYYLKNKSTHLNEARLVFINFRLNYKIYPRARVISLEFRGVNFLEHGGSFFNLVDVIFFGSNIVTT